MFFVIILSILIPIAYAIHVYLTKTKLSYWKERGVPSIPVTPFIGMPLENLLLNKSQNELFSKMYNMYKDSPLVGMYEGFNPILMIRDPKLVKLVTIKDFDHFVDRRELKNQSKDCWFNDNVMNLKGQEWKDIRSVITPTFTSGKMKRIFQIIDICAENCTDHLKTYAKSAEEIEIRDLIGRYTMDVIASSAFGIQCNPFKEKDPIFPRMAGRLMTISKLKMMRFFLSNMFPFIGKIFPIDFFDEEASKFFQTLVREAIQQRQKQEERGNDFLDLLLLASKGELEEDKESLEDAKHIRNKNTKMVLTESHVIAQSVLFLFAGYETTSSVISFAAYELALHPEIQDRLRDEVENTIGSSGKLTYDAVQKMEYLDMVINETMRRHTPAVVLERMCTKDYTIPGTQVTVKKGHLVNVPAVGFHMDPKYFPDPEKFDPDRFTQEEKAKRDPYVFMPFGYGPRNCVGLRFALMETKAVLAKILLKYTLVPCERTEIPIKYGKGFSLRPENGIWLKVENIKN